MNGKEQTLPNLSKFSQNYCVTELQVNGSSGQCQQIRAIKSIFPTRCPCWFTEWDFKACFFLIKL